VGGYCVAVDGGATKDGPLADGKTVKEASAPDGPGLDRSADAPRPDRGMPDNGPDKALPDLSADKALPDMAKDKATPPDLPGPDKATCGAKGSPCDDGNPCTHTDKCVAGGACKGTPYSCNDAISCTTDTCLGKPPSQGGCQNSIKAGFCHIGANCLKQGATSGGCLVCDPAFSARALAPAKGCVATLAGSTAGYVDGAAPTARFNSPAGVAADKAGAIYVADSKNHRIRKITGAKVSTLAGSGLMTTKDGVAKTAAFYNPMALDVNQATGAVYVAQEGGSSAGNHALIRAISKGMVSTFAGGGKMYIKDGLKKDWRLWKPRGVAVGLQGKVYVADSWHHVLAEVWGANIKLVAGVRLSNQTHGVKGHLDGLPTKAKFQYPAGLALGAQGKLYVADSGNKAVRVVQPGAVVTTLSKQFKGPQDLAVDAKTGVVYVSDTTAHRLYRVDKQGKVTVLAGTGVKAFADGPAPTASFNSPWGVVLLPSGYLVVADRGNHRIRVLNP